MESYLMMLYVTLEQETALKSFFVDQGWTFCKPDLSVTTDKLGPAVINAQPLDRESGNVTCINGKRKARTVPESAPKVKLVKVLTGTTAAQTETENLWRKSNEKHIKGVSVISNKDTEIDQFDSITATDPSESEDNENVIIKVEKNVGNSQEDDIQDYETEDVGDEDNDDTDIDDGMEVIEETSEEIVDEFGLNTKRNNDTGETSHRMKVVFGEKSNRTKYRSYTFEDLKKAYDAVKNDSVPIRKAARTFCVPEATLRHRVHGKVDMDCVNSGPKPIFSRDQEINLIEKLKHLVAEGSVLTQALVCDIATVYAAELGLRSLDDPLSKQWFVKFRSRWGSDVYDLFKVSMTEMKVQNQSYSVGVDWNS